MEASECFPRQDKTCGVQDYKRGMTDKIKSAVRHWVKTKKLICFESHPYKPHDWLCPF